MEVTVSAIHLGGGWLVQPPLSPVHLLAQTGYGLHVRATHFAVVWARRARTGFVLCR